MVSRDKVSKDLTSVREEKLAQALRANLRRRKAGGTAKASDTDKAKSGDEA